MVFLHLFCSSYSNEKNSIYIKKKKIKKRFHFDFFGNVKRQNEIIKKYTQIIFYGTSFGSKTLMHAVK